MIELRPCRKIAYAVFCEMTRTVRRNHQQPKPSTLEPSEPLIEKAGADSQTGTAPVRNIPDLGGSGATVPDWDMFRFRGRHIPTRGRLQALSENCRHLTCTDDIAAGFGQAQATHIHVWAYGLLTFTGLVNIGWVNGFPASVGTRG